MAPFSWFLLIILIGSRRRRCPLVAVTFLSGDDDDISIYTHTHTHTRETWKAPLPFCWRMQSELTCLLSSLSPCDVNFVSWHPPEKGVCRVCRVCKRVQLRYFRPLVARFSYFHFLLISPKSDLVIGPTNAPFSVKFLPLVGMCVEDFYTKSELDMLIRSRAMIFLLIVIKQIV